MWYVGFWSYIRASILSSLYLAALAWVVMATDVQVHDNINNDSCSLNFLVLPNN